LTNDNNYDPKDTLSANFGIIWQRVCFKQVGEFLAAAVENCTNNYKVGLRRLNPDREGGLCNGSCEFIRREKNVSTEMKHTLSL